jgi:hypothetical protein
MTILLNGYQVNILSFNDVTKYGQEIRLLFCDII